MAKEFFITTADNRFNYFTEFDNWLEYDTKHGYYTLERLANLAKLGQGESEAEVQEDTDWAIARLLYLNPTGNYVLTFNNETSSA